MPGPVPNSNTFTAYIAREVPELGLNLPSNAVGKDFLPGRALFASAPSGSGFQVSLYGLAGLLFAIDEGFELNVLGLNIGVDAAVPALKAARDRSTRAGTLMSRANPAPVPPDRHSAIESALRRAVESRRAVFARLSCPFGMDAVADRADTEVLDQYAVPDALMDEAGLIEPVG